MHLMRIARLGVLAALIAACGDSSHQDETAAGPDAARPIQSATPNGASTSPMQHGHGSDAATLHAIDASTSTQPQPHDAGASAATLRDAAANDAAPEDAHALSDSGAQDLSADSVPIIVAVGANHSIHLSIDEGHTFCDVQREVPADVGDGYDNPHLFRHVSYANDHFVTGSWKVVLASTNGYAWDNVSGGSAPALGNWVAEIDFGNGYWVGVGGYGGVMRSTDLQHWDQVDVGWETVAARSLAFGGGKFVASRDNNGWWSSTDGMSWAAFDTAQTKGVVYDEGAFVPDPGYRRARGVRLRAGGGGIERADDRDDAPYAAVASVQDGVADIAFGYAPAADYAQGRVMPAALAACLGL
jgi:hypothetical protein